MRFAPAVHSSTTHKLCASRRDKKTGSSPRVQPVVSSQANRNARRSQCDPLRAAPARPAQRASMRLVPPASPECGRRNEVLRADRLRAPSCGADAGSRVQGPGSRVQGPGSRVQDHEALSSFPHKGWQAILPICRSPQLNLHAFRVATFLAEAAHISKQRLKAPHQLHLLVFTLRTVFSRHC